MNSSKSHIPDTKNKRFGILNQFYCLFYNKYKNNRKKADQNFNLRQRKFNFRNRLIMNIIRFLFSLMVGSAGTRHPNPVDLSLFYFFYFFAFWIASDHHMAVFVLFLVSFGIAMLDLIGKRKNEKLYNQFNLIRFGCRTVHGYLIIWIYISKQNIELHIYF